MSAKKTLKELKDRIDKVSVTQLERQFMGTLIGKYSSQIDVAVKNQIVKGECSIPTLKEFLRFFPEYKSEAENLYIEKMKDNKGYEQVTVDTMVAQGALFDNLCFVYDSEKDTFVLATMNFELLYNLDVEYDMLKQVLTKNKKGIVKAYRIDIEYSNDAQEFSFKATNARDFDIDESKLDIDETKRFFLIPYIFVLRYIRYIELILNKNNVLTTLQKIDGVDKVRIITKNKDFLAKFCDNPVAVKNVEARFFPLKAFFYAPVVGSPSTTSMVTNINLFSLERLRPTSENDIKKYNIHKPKNPMKELIGEGLAINKLMALKSEDLNAFSDMINSFSNRGMYLSKNVEEIGLTGISKYLHSLSESGLNKVYKNLGLVEEIERRMSIISSTENRAMSAEDIENIGEILKNNICRLVIQKKNCTLSSIFCTNNKEILKAIYGDDYIAKYEGFSTKFYIFSNWLKDNLSSVFSEDVRSKLLEVGISCTDSDIHYIMTTMSEDISYEEYEEKIKYLLADTMGVSVKRSESAKKSKGGNILVRTLTSCIDSNGNAVEFYKYLDKSKIISGIIL